MKSVVEWVKKNMLRWFGHMERKIVKLVKKVYVSKTKSPRKASCKMEGYG